MTQLTASDGKAVTEAAAGHAGPDAPPQHEALAKRMALYGIDARARSALRALARFHRLDAAGEEWAAALTERLSHESGFRGERARTLGRFVDLFVQLPARDFSEEWLEELSGAWRELLAAGCSADLPLRAARQVTERCVQVLERGRDSYSRLDAEIALAVGAAGLLVCGILTDAAGGAGLGRQAQTEGAEFVDGAAGSVRTVLAAALALDNARITGILTGQVEAGSTATIAIEEEGWAHIYARSLSRLRHALRDRDVLCRVGRSRFAVVLPGLTSEAQVMLAANKVARLFDSPLSAAGHECRLLVRIGAAWAPKHGQDAAHLLRRSNLALHEASRVGRSVAMFEEALLQKAERESQMEEDFLRALDCGGLALHFQPQIDCRTGRCVGAEALLRWPSAKSGPVAPTQTIDIAERLGVGPQFTRWILHQACRSAAEFARLGVVVETSINLTAADVGDPELPLAVRNALDLWHLEPRLLKFELTESAMLANEAVSARIMASLCELGVSTSIDDFGTGYSSVILLKKLPLNELKLDRSFVASAVHSHQDREIVRSLILLAHSLQLEVVAEGVEDEATLALLRDFGCDRAQGFLISKALPAEEFLAWARAYEPGCLSA